MPQPEEIKKTSQNEKTTKPATEDIWTGLLEEFSKFDSILNAMNLVYLRDEVIHITKKMKRNEFLQIELPLLAKYASAIRKFIEYYYALSDHAQLDSKHRVNPKNKSDITKNRENLIAEKQMELLTLNENPDPVLLDKFIESMSESIALVKKLDELNEKNSKLKANTGQEAYEKGCKTVYKLLKKPNKDKYILMAKSLDNAINAHAGERKEEISVFYANDIPRVVNFKHLGDPERGYLIGESECRLLQDVLKDVSAGRHSKTVVKDLLLKKGLQHHDIENKFPYLPGVIIQRCKIDLTFKRPNAGEYATNVLYVFMENNELFYTIKNNKGEIQTHKITEQEVYKNSLEIWNKFNKKFKELTEQQKEKKSGQLSSIVISNAESLYQMIFNIAKNMGHAEHEVYAIYSGKDPAQGDKRNVLGKGNFGEVKAAFNINEKKWQVDKVLLEHKGDDSSIPLGEKKGNVYSTSLQLATKEANISLAFERGKGVVTSRQSKKEADTTKHNITLDYIEGIDLKKFLNTHSDISSVRSLNIAISMINAIEKMHKKGYYHVDLTHTGNFMYNPVSDKLSVIDFGKTKQFNDQGQISFYLSKADHDAYPHFWPPELKTDEWSPYTEKTELFMLAGLLGIVLYENPQLKEDEDVKALIKNMRADKADQRPSLAEARRILETVRLKHAFANYKKVGLLNISDYLSANLPEKKAMFEALKQVDSVILIDDERKYTPAEYYEIRRRLLDEGVFVENNIIFSNDTDALVDRVKEQFKNIEGVVSYYYIHTYNAYPMHHQSVQSVNVNYDTQTDYSIRKEMLQHTALVSKNDLLKVQKALKSSLEQYMQEKSVDIDTAPESTAGIKYTNKPTFFPQRKLEKIGKNVVQITKFQKEIDNSLEGKKGSWTYAQLIGQLNQLDRELSGNKNKSKIPQSIQHVRSIKHELEESVTKNVLKR